MEWLCLFAHEGDLALFPCLYLYCSTSGLAVQAPEVLKEVTCVTVVEHALFHVGKKNENMILAIVRLETCISPNPLRLFVVVTGVSTWISVETLTGNVLLLYRNLNQQKTPEIGIRA